MTQVILHYAHTFEIFMFHFDMYCSVIFRVIQLYIPSYLITKF